MLYFEILTMVTLSIINYTCPLCRAKATRGSEVSFWQLACRQGYAGCRQLRVLL